MKLKEPIFECKFCKTNYLRKKYRCPNCNEPGITKLYKFVSYNANSLSIIKNKEVWFPKAKVLNDPFEFQFKIIENQNNRFSINSDSVRQAIEDSKELGVFCMTEVSSNILMWAHYADNHKGFCIEFERLDDNDLGKEFCVPVFYPEDNQFPRYQILDLQKPETFKSIATTKTKLWSYEQEWRIISREKGNKLYSLPGNITAIIFGKRMHENHKKIIKDILSPEMHYFKTNKSKDYYQLKITPDY